MPHFAEGVHLWNRHTGIDNGFAVGTPFSREDSAFRQLLRVNSGGILQPAAFVSRNVELEIRSQLPCGVDDSKVDVPQLCLSLFC